jgi:alpha-L-rhamnosidase
MPHPGGGLTSASATLKTMYGTIQSEWNVVNDKINYICSVPPNTSATISFEHTDAKDILVNDQPLLATKTVALTNNGEKVKIEVGSGKYKFQFLNHQ